MRGFAMIGLASALALGACNDAGAPPASSADTAPPADMAAGAPTPTDAMGFVAAAGASDLYEMQSSQLALQKASRADVKQFAQQMLTDHMKTTQSVTAAAQSAGMTPPPPQLMPKQADMIVQLQPLSGADFDRTYLSQQVQAHQEALALHTSYSQSGDTPALKQAAAGAVPIVRMHYDHVRRLAGM